MAPSPGNRPGPFQFVGMLGAGGMSEVRRANDARLGREAALDGDPGIRPSARAHVAYAACREPIPDDGLPRCPEARQG